jgi:hypothetical protein
MNKRLVVIISRLFFSLLVVVALVTQLIIQIRNSASIINYFSFFTNLSNLIAAVTLIYGSIHVIKRHKHSPKLDAIRGATFVYMVIVGAVFSILLRNVELGSLLPWVNDVLHYIMPVFIIFDFIYQPPDKKLPKSIIKYWLIFPLIYLIYSLVRGPQAHFYPYPFLNPSHKGGYPRVALFSVSILIVFILTSYLAIYLASKKQLDKAA